MCGFAWIEKKTAETLLLEATGSPSYEGGVGGRGRGRERGREGGRERERSSSAPPGAGVAPAAPRGALVSHCCPLRCAALSPLRSLSASPLSPRSSRASARPPALHTTDTSSFTAELTAALLSSAFSWTCGRSSQRRMRQSSAVCLDGSLSTWRSRCSVRRSTASFCPRCRGRPSHSSRGGRRVSPTPPRCAPTSAASLAGSASL